MTTDLQKAIAEVYSAFDDVPRPSVVVACNCCVSDQEASTMLSKSLRELTPDDLGSYASSAFVTADPTEDFFYFIPRILEILAVERYWWPSPEIVASALYRSGFHIWPTPRRDAALRYFKEVWNDLLSNDRDGYDLDGWICAFGRLRLDLESYLSRIAAAPDRFWDLYEENLDRPDERRLVNPFWDEAPEAHRVVVEWLVDTAERIKRTNPDAGPDIL